VNKRKAFAWGTFLIALNDFLFRRPPDYICCGDGGMDYTACADANVNEITLDGIIRSQAAREPTILAPVGGSPVNLIDHRNVK
jgi:hypothetical protein